MLDQQILDEALTKKNKEYENLKNQHFEMKKNYEAKIKNLMNSINLLKSEKTMIETNTKDNIRVNIINKLKEERADQELIISLLRKLIGDEDKIDKYLTKEFSKKGAQRAQTYEELKIKIKQLEAEIVSLKFKNLTSKKPNNNNNTMGESYCDAENDNLNFNSYSESKLKSANNYSSNKRHKSGKIDFAKIESDEIIELKMAEKFKFEITKYEEKIQNLEKENTLLKIAKDKMEKSQNELFEKLKNYNEEIGELKSIYDTIKKNLEDECNTKVNDAMKIINVKEAENAKLKEKINEMIEICERQNKENLDSIKRLNSENELLRRLLEAKKYEIGVLASEIKNYQIQLDNNRSSFAGGSGDNTKDLMRIRNIEKEKEELKKTNAVNEEKIKHLDSVIKQKEFLLESLHNSIEDKEKVLREKEQEIDLLNEKMQEMEIIMMKNYVKNQYKNF